MNNSTSFLHSPILTGLILQLRSFIELNALDEDQIEFLIDRLKLELYSPSKLQCIGCDENTLKDISKLME